VGSPSALISFVIPVRNDAQRLERCLMSIAADAGATPHETLVIDNDSADDSALVARRLGATVLMMPGSVAVLRNAGVSQTSAPYIAFVDADHQIAPGWTMAALAALREPDVAGVGAPYHAPDDGTWVQRAYDGLRRHPTRVEPAEWFGAGNLVVRRQAFDAIGGFDVSLESCEDVDLCARLRAGGWRLLNVPAMRSVHHGDPPTLGRVFWSELWRGRDNIRVSLRAPWSIKNTVSMAIPIVELVAVPLSLAGALWWWPLGVMMLVLLLALIGLRVAALLRNTGGANPSGIGAAIAVAIAYDAGRAAALVARAGHHRRAPVAQSTT
jgi:GT2 family glycosyltransferase